MCDTPLIFEPTLTLRESNIAVRMSDLSLWQADAAVEDNHLAGPLGVKREGTAFWDFEKNDRGSPFRTQGTVLCVCMF